ncbi:MAG TPA: hypothetical protein VFU50_02350 [Terriglobales bacterium]|nr:hypothetical protein [Terriglobales bacterium]
MQRQLHFTPAIAAITFVLCLAGFAFVVLVLLPSPFAQQLVPVKSIAIAHGAAHLGKAAVYVVLIGYAAGIVGWLATFGLQCDGMHRLASVLEHLRCK